MTAGARQKASLFFRWQWSSNDQLKDPNERDIYSYYQFVSGAYLATQGELAKGYAAILESRKLQPVPTDPEFALQGGGQNILIFYSVNQRLAVI